MADLDAEVKENSEIKLVSSTGKEFIINKAYALISVTIKNNLEAAPNAESVPLNVDSDSLELIVEFMRMQKGVDCAIPDKPLKSKNMEEICVDKKVADFLNKVDAGGSSEGRYRTYTLVMNANYLNINGLLHAACAKIASLIMGEPLSKITEILQCGEKNPQLNLASKDVGDEDENPFKSVPADMLEGVKAACEIVTGVLGRGWLVSTVMDCKRDGDNYKLDLCARSGDQSKMLNGVQVDIGAKTVKGA